MKITRKWRRAWQRAKPAFMLAIAKAAQQSAWNRQRKSRPADRNGQKIRRIAHEIRQKAVAASVALAIMTASPGVEAMPAGGQVAAGQGSIAQTGSSMTITQATDKLALNWQSFSIAQGEKVQFNQPTANSVALNRVLGNSASQIFGQLSANGKVFLTNQNGILFARSAQVDVGGLVASSLHISDSDFMNGKYAFTKQGSAGGSVVNQGSIRVADGGYAVLLGEQVLNEGAIIANKGTVALAAGEQATLDLAGDGLINLAVGQAAINAQVENKNLIQADGGLVVMTSRAVGDLAGAVVNNSGIIRSQGLTERNGKIVLDGGTNGVVQTTGTLDVSAASGKGGIISVTGDKILVGDNARLDASGAKGGGEIYVGGGWQGSGELSRATATVVAATATLDASATDKGDGGTVVVWSDQFTNFAGAINAKGVGLGSTGGAVETSSVGVLNVTGVVNTATADGNNGMWLLDPRNVSIVSAGSISIPGAGGTFDASADSSQISADSISTALSSGNSVTITTGSTGTQDGNITVLANITKSAGGDASLTLQAAKNITLTDATIKSTAGKLNVTLSAGISAAGQIELRKDPDNTSDTGGSAILTNGGNIWLGGAVVSGVLSPLNATSIGIHIEKSQLEAGSGNIEIKSQGGTTGVALSDSKLNTTSGNILIEGTSGFGVPSQGVSMQGNASRDNMVISTDDGDIIIKGTSLGGTDWANYGIWQVKATIKTAGNGNITLEGTSGPGAHASRGNNMGIKMVNDSLVQAFNGNISITGTGSTSLAEGFNYGVWIGSSSIIATGAGGITLQGTGGSGGNYNFGVVLDQTESNSSLIEAQSGDIAITGTGSAGGSILRGIWATRNTAIKGHGGAITLTGSAPQGGHAIITRDGTYTSSITNEGTGTITLTGLSGSVQVGQLTTDKQAINVTAAENIIVKDTINAGTTLDNTGGVITLTANTAGNGGSVTDTAGITIAADGLVLKGAGASYTLNQATYYVNRLAADTGSITYSQSGGVSIDTTGGVSGIKATGDVSISAPAPTSGTSTVYVNAPIEIAAATTADITLQAGNYIVIQAPIRATSGLVNLTLDAANDVTQSAAGDIEVGGLRLLNGSFNLTNTGNSIATLAAVNAGVVNVVSGDSMIVGTVSGASGVATRTGAQLTVAAADGLLTVDQPIVFSISGYTLGLTADRMAINAAVDLPTTATILPYSVGRAIHLGSGVDSTANTLELSAAEFARFITPSALRIGDANSGAITISQTMNRKDGAANLAGLILTSGSSITETGGGALVAASLVANANGVVALNGANTVSYFSSNSNNHDIQFRDVLPNEGGLAIYPIGTYSGINAGSGNLTLTIEGNGSVVNMGSSITAAGLELVAPASRFWFYGTPGIELTISTLAGNVGTAAIGAKNSFSIGTVGSTVGLTSNGVTISSGLKTALGLESGGTITQTAPINAIALYLGKGDFSLTDANNHVQKLTTYSYTYDDNAHTGSINYRDSGALAINTAYENINASGSVTLQASSIGFNSSGGSGITAGGAVTLQSSSTIAIDNAIATAGGLVTVAAGTDITLNGIISSADGDIVLAAGRNFINNMATGTGIVPGTGRYSVYSANPSDSSEGMTGYNKRYNQTYTAGSTPSYAASGNWFFYSIAPVLTVAPGSQTVVYGTAPSISASYVGFIDGDVSSTAGISGTAAFSVGGAKSTSNNYVVGSHEVTYSSGLASSLGYQFQDKAASTNELTVTAKNIAVTATGINKVYDRETGATVTYSDTRVDGDVLTVSGTASFGDKNVGENKAVGVSGIAIGGTDAGNYNLTNTTTATAADITKRDIAVTATGVNKVYNATTDATVTYSDTRLGGDVLTVSGTASFGDKNVGTNKVVGVTGIAIGGTDAGNYNLTNTTTATAADITKRDIAVTATGVNKVYNATTDATVTYSDTRLGGDVLTVSGTASFGDKNVGENKAVGVTGIAIGGTDAGNYNLTNTTAATTADITKRDIAVTASGVNKVYNATTDATVTYVDTRLGGDVLTVSGTASFGDKNVGENKAVGVTGIAIGGTDAGNYNLTNTAAATTAEITKRDIAVTASGVNKVYTATIGATVTYVDTRLGGDVLTVSGTASFGDKNVGEDKAVGVTGIAISGTDAGNYNLTNTTAATTADITKRDITVTATGIKKDYDGTTAATVTYGDNRITDDVLTVSGTARFYDKNVGAGKQISVTGIVISGADAGNYRVAATASGAIGTITPATLTYTADPATRYQGLQNPALSGTVTGFVNGETMADATTGTMVFFSPATPLSLPGTYPIVGTGLTANNGNYLLVQKAENASALTITTNVQITTPAITSGDGGEALPPALRAAVQSGNEQSGGGQQQQAPIYVAQGGVNSPPTAPVTQSPVMVSVSSSGGQALNYSLTVAGRTVTLSSVGGGASSPTAQTPPTRRSVALVALEPQGTQTVTNHSVTIAAGTLTIGDSPDPSRPIPAEPPENPAYSETYSLIGANGATGLFRITFANQVASTTPLNEAAIVMAQDTGTARQVVVATGMLTLAERFGSQVEIATFYLHTR